MVTFVKEWLLKGGGVVRRIHQTGLENAAQAVIDLREVSHREEHTLPVSLSEAQQQSRTRHPAMGGKRIF